MTKNRNAIHNRRAFWLTSLLVFPFVTPSAGALVTIGEQTDLYFNGSATVRVDDNIFLSDDNEESDTIFILSPGLELNIGSRQNANINIYYREDFYRYDDNDDLDDELSNVFFEAYMNQARLDLRVNASYQELNQPDASLLTVGIPDQLIEREEIRAGVRGEYEISELTSASLGFQYYQRDFESPLFVDRDSYTVPVNFYYALRPQVDVSVGYRFRHTDNGRRRNLIGINPPVFGPANDVADTDDHYFNVGVRGEVAPKLMGEANVGYQLREVDGGSDRDTLSFEVDFSHFTTASTTILVGLFRDFDTGGQGATHTRTGGGVGLRHAFNHLLTGSAGVNYYERNYERVGGVRREDETLDLHAGLTYSPIRYVDLSATYIYRTNDSTIDALEFDNNIFSVSASLRY